VLRGFDQFMNLVVDNAFEEPSTNAPVQDEKKQTTAAARQSIGMVVSQTGEQARTVRIWLCFGSP
jgi:small nuclear ribonucleoprotein (snRNP)-like protein